MSSRTAAGIAVRRLLPALIVVPVVWGSVSLLGQRLALYGPAIGAGFLVIGNLVALFALALWSIQVGIGAETTRMGLEREVEERDAQLRSAQRFRELVQSAPVGIHVLREGKIVFANSALAAMLGYDGPSDLVGRGATEWVHPEELSIAKDPLRPTSVEGAPSAHVRCFKRDGSIVILESASSPTDFDGMPSILSIARDVTAQFEADALREQVARMIDGVRDYAILLLDKDGRVQSWNAGAQLINGYQPGEIVGRPLSTFYPQEIRERAARLLELATSVGRSEDEGWRLRKDGSRFWANVIITAIRDAQGTLSGFVSVARDLSEQKQTVDDLHAALAGKQTALRELRRSEEVYRAIVQHLPNGAVLMIDRDLRYVTADGPLIGALLERTKLEGLVGRKVVDVVSAANKDSILDTYQSAMRGERRYLEITMGEQFFDLNAVPIFDGDEITHALIFLYDVTSRKVLAAQAEALHEERRRRNEQEHFHLLAETIPQIVWTAKPDGALDFYNGRWFDYTGLTLEETKGWGWGLVLHPDDLQNCVEVWSESVRTGNDYEVHYRFKRASDGQYRWHLGRARPMRDATGQIIKWFGTCTDIDDQRRAEDELREHQQQLEIRVQERTSQLALEQERVRALVVNSPVAISEIDLQGNVVSRNQRWAEFAGIPMQAVWSREERLAAVHPEDRNGFIETFLSPQPGTSRRFDYRLRNLDGKVKWLTSLLAPMRNGAGVLLGFLVTTMDVTAPKEAAEAVQRSLLEKEALLSEIQRERALFETTLANVTDGVAMLGADRRVIVANQAYAGMFGLPRAQLEAMTREHFIEHISSLLQDPSTFVEIERAPKASEEFFFARPHRRILRRTWTRVSLPTGEDGFLVTWHDVTAEKDLIRERERELMIDGLTGIPNRRAAQAALLMEEARKKRSGTSLCVAVFDIDHFKRVNDTFGHPTGDDVIRQIAATLVAQARLTDTVARWGGEEFLAVLPVKLDGARVFCERARAAVESLIFPNASRITISAGVAELHSNETTSATIARADERLYEAKRLGRNRVHA